MSNIELRDCFSCGTLALEVTDCKFDGQNLNVGNHSQQICRLCKNIQPWKTSLPPGARSILTAIIYCANVIRVDIKKDE